MPWMNCNPQSMKEEFVKLAMQPNANRRELIRRFKISTKTAYKWINRYEKGGLTALADQSRRPKSSPTKTPEVIEKEIIRLRKKYPAWGARKLRRLLLNDGVESVPAASTVTEILRRN